MFYKLYDTICSHIVVHSNNEIYYQIRIYKKVLTAKLPPLLFGAVCLSVFFHHPLFLRVIYHRPTRSNIPNTKLSIKESFLNSSL